MPGPARSARAARPHRGAHRRGQPPLRHRHPRPGQTRRPLPRPLGQPPSRSLPALHHGLGRATHRQLIARSPPPALRRGAASTTCSLALETSRNVLGAPDMLLVPYRYHTGTTQIWCQCGTKHERRFLCSTGTSDLPPRINKDRHFSGLTRLGTMVRAFRPALRRYLGM